MPLNIYSNVKEDLIVLTIMRYEELNNNRNDLCPNDQYIQFCARKLELNLEVKPHKHLSIHRNSDITQEAWVILDGSIYAKFYDINNHITHTSKLKKGDVAILYRGGHSFKVIEENTVFYEIKNGPYIGSKFDKENI